MTTESYTSKDGRVTVRDGEPDPDTHWAVIIDKTVPPPSNGCRQFGPSWFPVPKTLFPDPQLLADQVAEQQPKPRYVVGENRKSAWVCDHTSGWDPVSFRKDYYPDAREKAEQEAAALNARAVSDE